MSESKSNHKKFRISGSESNQNAAESFRPTASSNFRQPQQRIVQNHVLLWLDTSIDQTNEDYENTLKQIQTITHDVNVFTQRDACIDFLTDTQEEIKSFLIVKDTMSQQIMPLINDIPQLDSIYIFNATEIPHEQWTKRCNKIKSVHTNIDDLCQALRISIKQFSHDSIPMSFITANEIDSTGNLNQLEPTFMYTQIFKDILLDIEHGEQAIKQFVAYCRDHDCVSAIYIDRFEKEYSSKAAIWWYTFPSDIYSMLNYGLRTMNADIIITMGFFLRDVHEQIQQLYEQQVNSFARKPFLVYRGQGLKKLDFEKLQKTKGGLISFNNFLSTSTDKEISLGFAQGALENRDMVGILFRMSIDPCIKSVPFASIKEVSYFKEGEILFSMHTVFRVGAIERMGNENQMYEVELQLTSDEDQQLRLLTDRLREEPGGTGWYRLGDLLLKIGQFNKAEELYNLLVEHTSDESEKALYYNQLGGVYMYQGNYEKAIWYYKELLKIREKSLPSNHSHLAAAYNNIGIVYDNIGEYSTALTFYEEALKFFEKTLASNHPSFATLYSNFGLVYYNMGEYSKALSFYEKALEIYRKALPPNHPSLATSYNNIGMVYHNMREYLKALSSHEKTLEIYQKTLPPLHPLLATSYNNIGMVYHNMGEYSKALSSHEKALEIRQETLPFDHPDLATSYNNIGVMYDNMGEYSKALSFYEKALKIFEKTRPSDHSLLGTSYNNIGLMYHNMKEYPKALSCFERALGIWQRALPATHPHIKTVEQSIEFVEKIIKNS
ncbi:unnamed protein product [Adineta steineri]|uniref:Kinesin light chain n=1 Tax=Adineta steineri TaxID=433720 RepID=A0A813Y0E0_9BILA|nr:unnamed protein product [Adineta steineri]